MRCPYCGKSFKKKKLAVAHIEKMHVDKLEVEKMDACQAIYFNQHGRLTGTCMNCGGPTDWNFKTGKPSRVCNDPKCREQLRAAFSTNMKRTYGTDNLLSDMEHQRAMQHNRRIAGTYTFKKDGGKVEYLGKLEHNFLMFCDTVLDLPSSMILEPPEYFPYFDEKTGTWRTYMPDFYLPDYNLLVEIKDGGDHPNGNKAFQDTTKYKVEFKDRAMREQSRYNFIRISGTNYGPFLETLYQIVHEQEDDEKKRNAIVVINEAACNDLEDHIECGLEFEKIDPTRISLLTGYIHGSNIPRFVAITDSRIMADWYISDFENQSLQHTLYNNALLSECDCRQYSYVGNVEKMRQAFPAIVTAAEQAEGQYEWNILVILATSGICLDDGLSIKNNDKREMDFICLEGVDE